nr:GreA/GreB family elongation factor [Coprococcus sp. AF21-14LB]
MGLNNTVEIYFEDEDETETFKLVTTVRGNSLAGKISTESPIGKAVLGHKVGDRVFVKVGESGGYYVQIRALDKTSDDSDALRKF